MLLDADLSRDMDRITQLQDGVLELLTQTSTTISVITSSAHREQTNPDLPIEPRDAISVQTTDGDRKVDRLPSGQVEMPTEDFENTKRDLLDGFMTKAKQVSKLIDSFPNVDVDPERDDRLKSLEEEMKIANSEYKEAVKEAESLLRQIKSSLNVVMADNIPGFDARNKQLEMVASEQIEEKMVDAE